jgi:hypothetical protein
MTQAVDYAVERLTQNWTDVVAPSEAGGEYKHVNHGPLLDLLRQAVASSLGRTTSGPGGGNERSPIDLKSFTLMETIDGIVRAWGREFGLDYKSDLKSLLVTVHGKLEILWAHDRIAKSVYVGLTDGFVRWADDIWLMFDPPIRKEIVAACPNPMCGERYYLTRDGDRQAALVAEVRQGFQPRVECQRCHANWEGKESMLQLARSIGANTNFDELGHEGAA